MRFVRVAVCTNYNDWAVLTTEIVYSSYPDRNRCPGPPDFVAIDVETANANVSSICQIAVVSFARDQVVHEWHSLVNPEEPFAPLNVQLHGIDSLDVRSAPSFPMIAEDVISLMAGNVVASHMAFDRVALERVCSKYALSQIPCMWLDTARVSRRTWSQFKRRGYALKSVASQCGIQVQHHNALEDAKAAGSVLVRAISESGINIDGWLSRLAVSPRVGRRSAEHQDLGVAR